MSAFFNILIQLLFLMSSLVLVGEPLRVLLSGRLFFLKELDFLQVLILDVHLGGLILYVIAMVPFHVFNAINVMILLIATVGLSMVLHRKKLHAIRKKILQKNKSMKIISGFLFARRISLLKTFTVLTFFLVILSIQIIPLSNFIYGSVHDTSLHALFVEVIIENRQVPENLMPYEPTGVVYPQAFHVVAAYANYTLAFSPPQAVFYVTSLFNAMTVLGVYFLGRKLFSKELFSVNLAFLFAFLSTWPMYITWGANPFVGGFPLFFISLSFLLSFIESKDKKFIGESAFIGILLGYLGAVMISFYETLVVSTTLLLAFKALREPHAARARLINIFTVFVFSLLPIGVMLYRVIAFYPLPGHNIGVYADVLPTGLYTNLDLITVLKSSFEKLNPHPFLQQWMQGLLLMSLIGISYLFFRKHEESPVVGKIAQAAAANIAACTILISLTYQGGIWNSISWGHQTFILVAFLCLIVGALCTWLSSIFKRIYSTKFIGRFLNAKPKTKVAILILILFGIYAPFMYYRVTEDPQTLIDSYALFAITTQDDYETMSWMKDFLPRNATILVNPFEPGLFIPSVSHHKIIFAFTANQRSYSYQKLVDLIQNKTLNSTTYSLMRSLNVTHVYVGSRATYWWDADHKWDSYIFLQRSSNFKLIRNVGEAYLFKVLYA